MSSNDVQSGSGTPDHPGSPDGIPVFSSDADELINAIERARDPREPNAIPEEELKDTILPGLRLPGFGEPLDDCGDFIPESMHFCSECYDTKQFPRNCFRYDCPEHALHAVRRRAAGSDDAAGVCPQLDALRRYLNAYRDKNQYFHHMTFEPPTEFYWQAGDPLERAKEVVRELMDALGIQGAVAYHPFKGDHEEEEKDDMGEWRQRLGSGRDWRGDVRDELKPKGHFHVVGVAPHIDLSDVGEVYDETGWVIHRITQNDSNVSIGNDKEMVAAVTYALSHAGVYGTESGQRRLAAWMKGPDVPQVSPTEQNKYRMKAMVREVSEQTLGIDAPSMDCSVEVDRLEVRQAERFVENPDDSNGYELERDATTPSPISAPTPGGGATRTSDLDFASGPGRTSLGSSSSSWSTSGSASTAAGGSTVDGAADRDESDGHQEESREETETCGGHIKHISVAGEFLLDGDRRERATFVDDLEDAYRSYVNVMQRKGLELHEGRREIPEFRDADPPP